MEAVRLGSSSEEEDAYDTYLNSVAKLKALKNQTSLNVEKEELMEDDNELCTIEEPKTISITETEESITRRQVRNRARKANLRSRKLNQTIDAENNDPEVQIVSAEEKPNSHTQCGEFLQGDLLPRERRNPGPSGDENYECNIKVLWRSKTIHRFNIGQNTNFREIYDYFANLEGVSLDEILITRKDKAIRKNDTPASIGLSVIDILEGGVVRKAAGKSCLDKKKVIDGNSCVIKVQTRNKECITFLVEKRETFVELVSKCSKELKLEESKIKLCFDGEAISATDTPESLEIDDEACFDLVLSL